MDQTKLRAFLIDLFKTLPKIEDPIVHKIAEKLNLSKDTVENEIYAILSSLLTRGEWGKLKVKPKVDAQQLKRGKEVEMEHTDCPSLAEKIALDHLVELPDYYTRLDIMEEEGKKEYQKEKLKILIRDIFKESK